MTVLSRFATFFGSPILHTNCYETVHTWHPDCTQAILEAVPNGIRFSLRTYATFYLVASLLAKRNPKKIDWKRYVQNVLQSSFFLMTNLILYLYLMCRIRNIVGFYTPITLGGISSALASFIAIWTEKASRRPALALYLTNLASETYYRHLVNEGVMVSFKYGQCVPFAAGLAMFMYLYSKKSLDPSIQKFLKLTHRIDAKQDDIKTMGLPSAFGTFLQKLRTDYGKSEKCEHENSCVSVSLEMFAKNFVVGLGLSSALTLLKNIGLFVKNPIAVLRKLFSFNSQRLPLFFALMPFIFHSIKCSLNRLSITGNTATNVLAGSASSLAMILCPNTTIAMYTLWKAIEMVYAELLKKGLVPKVKYWDIMLYSLATGYVLWMSTIQPHSLRKGYLHFLLGLTGQRLRVFNRDLFEHFGYQSSKQFGYVPKLIEKYTTLNPSIYQHVVHPTLSS